MPPLIKVIVTAAAPYVPPRLIEQLKPGGRMVIPVGEGSVQHMLRLTLQADGGVIEEVFDNFSFVPLIGRQEQLKKIDDLIHYLRGPCKLFYGRAPS